jgi:hypothetical protein
MDIGSAHESVWKKFSSGKIKQMGPDLKKISGLPSAFFNLFFKTL